MTFLGAAGTAWSAVPFNGKLSWVINELQSSRRVRLVHNNIYEDGLDGLLEDIRGKVDLPEKLCLVNSFNLHFRADEMCIRDSIRTVWCISPRLPIGISSIRWRS